jgi:hypothetical protein
MGSILRYVPLEKVEDQPDGTIKVWGFASSEAQDADGDIIKADAMKAAIPAYMEYGNIREMHSNIAAGVAFECEVLENGKTWLGAHIVDEGSVKKVKAGVLKGFSIGGNGLECEPDNPKVITALELNEISLVDRPANPDSVIQLWKAKKMNAPATLTEEQAVEEVAAMLTNKTISATDLLALVKAAKEQPPTGSAVKAAQTEENTDTEKPNNDKDGPVKKVAGDGDDEKTHDGDCDGEHDDCPGCMKLKKAMDEDDDSEAMEKFTKASDSDKPYGDVKYADPGYQEDGKKRYPIDTEEHIRAAWNYINKEKNASKYTADQVKKIKAKIVAAWKEKIDKDGPPSADEGKEKSIQGGDMTKATKVDPDNGTAGAYPKKGDIVLFKDGEFTHQAEINEVGDGVASVNGKTFEVNVAVDKLGKDDSEANEGPVKWVTTMDQAHGWKFKESNEEHMGKAAGGKQTLEKGKKLQKGMYDIIDFCYAFMQLKSLQNCMGYEQLAEKDPDSKAKAALDAWIDAGKQVLKAIVGEELGEMDSAEDLDIEDVIIDKAAQSGLLQKGLSVFLESAGPEAISSMHEFTAQKLQKMAPDNDLEKAIKDGDIGAIVKAYKAQTDAALQKMSSLEAELKALKDQPAGHKPLSKAATAGSKDTDAPDADAPAPVVGQNGKVDDAATAIKKALTGGGNNLFNLSK